MLYAFFKIVGLLALVAACFAGLSLYQRHDPFAGSSQQAPDEPHMVERIGQRLTVSRRTAELLVREQSSTDGQPRTSVLFVERAPDGLALTTRWITLHGDRVHMVADVLRFDHPDDPFRGRSVSLFARLYGNLQKPAEADAIDIPGQIPDIYQSSDPRVSDLELAIWGNVWRLIDDPSLQKAKSIHVTQAHETWPMFQPNRLYTLALDTAGRLTLQSRPLVTPYREPFRLK